MPNASGQLYARDVSEIRRMARTGMKSAEIAEIIGCSTDSVIEYSGALAKRMRQAAQYDRIVRRASVYVPTFGGGA